MNRLLTLDAEFCRQLALVLFHVTWSGTLLAGVAALAARRVSPRAPLARYAIHFSALLGILLLVPLWTVRVHLQPAVDRQPIASATDLPVAGDSWASSESLDFVADGTLPPGTDLVVAETSFAPTEAVITAPPPTRFDWHQFALRGITLAYVSGVAVMLLRLLLAAGGGERLRLAGTPIGDTVLLRTVAEQSRRLGLRAIPLLRICERTAIPVVVGAFRPVILIPAAMIAGLTPEQMAGVLMHELAHIRRYDHLLILVQRFVEALLFFHPVVWYLSRCVNADREDCCDDLVLATGSDPLEYAGALLRVAELRLRPTNSRQPAGALAADGNRPSDLRRRLARVLGVDSEPVLRLSKPGLAALLVPVVAGTAVAFAQLESSPERASKSNSARDASENRADRSLSEGSNAADKLAAPEAAEPEQAEPSIRGTLKGRFVYDGKPPAPKPIDFPPPRPAADGRVAGTTLDNDYFRQFKVFDESLKVGPEGGVENIVIWLRSADMVVAREEKEIVVVSITAREGRFVPHIAPVHAPQTVIFRNEAEVAHNFHLLPKKGDSQNRLVAAKQHVSISVEKAEAVPIVLSDDIHPWLKAYLLPLSHPYVAVTSATGEFRIENIPAGKWEFAFWHERCGWLKTGAMPTGRSTLRIGAEASDLGTIRVSATLFEKDSAPRAPQKPVESSQNTHEAQRPDGWFWPDPIPGLGHTEGASDGYQYLRIASDGEAGKELRTTADQQATLEDLYSSIARRESGLAKELVRAGLDVGQRKKRLAEEWEQGRKTARGILTEEQDRRVGQLLLQRLSYIAFLRDDVARMLELTDRQRERIAAAIAAHGQRIHDNEAELGRAVERLRGHLKSRPVLIRQPNGLFREQPKPDASAVVDESIDPNPGESKVDPARRLGGEDRASTLDEHIDRLTGVKVRKGRLLHRQVWYDIREILTPAQRDQFSALRGPMPETVRSQLHFFYPETDDDDVRMNNEKPGRAAAKTLTITIVADADGQVASLTVGLAKLFNGPLDDDRLHQLDKRLKDVFAIEGTFDQVLMRVGGNLKYQELNKVIKVCMVQKMADGNFVKKISFMELGEK